MTGIEHYVKLKRPYFLSKLMFKFGLRTSLADLDQFRPDLTVQKTCGFDQIFDVYNNKYLVNYFLSFLLDKKVFL